MTSKVLLRFHFQQVGEAVRFSLLGKQGSVATIGGLWKDTQEGTKNSRLPHPIA
jgi:hypothetical protein